MNASVSASANAPGAERRATPGWSAQLSLRFAVVAGRTALVHRAHKGPLSVQRPFYPEADLAHIYLLHPPGGVVAGDQLSLQVDVASGARVLITTPAATKFYRSEGRVAEQRQLLRVSAGASLEYLPQETIVYGAAQAQTETRVELEPGGVFCGWDIVALGRAASGDHFDTGRLSQAFEIWEGGRPLWIERSRFAAEEPVRRAPWGLRGSRVFGTFVCSGVSATAVAAVREACVGSSQELFAVTQTRSVIVCRYLGDNTERARQMFTLAWVALRPILLGRPASPPRIWLT
jgi:urease accessory protein